MDTTKIKDLNFSNRDFDLIIEGLEHLPEKGAAGELIGDLFAGMLSKDMDDSSKNEMQRDLEVKRLEKKKETESLKEDIRILQGKLISMKRIMHQEGIINEVKSILTS